MDLVPVLNDLYYEIKLHSLYGYASRSAALSARDSHRYRSSLMTTKTQWFALSVDPHRLVCLHGPHHTLAYFSRENSRRFLFNLVSFRRATPSSPQRAAVWESVNLDTRHSLMGHAVFCSALSGDVLHLQFICPGPVVTTPTTTPTPSNSS